MTIMAIKKGYQIIKIFDNLFAIAIQAIPLEYFPK
jgi:hypothetical protein